MGTDPDVIASYETLAERAQTTVFGFEDEVAVVDIETTGYDCGRDHIIEIAAAILRGPEVTETLTVLVDPLVPVPLEITKLTGITDEMIAGQPSVEDAVSRLVAFVGGPDSLIDIGYLGEAVILDSTCAGLGTCWIAGSFRAETAAALVSLADGERVCAVTPLGHAAENPSGAEKLLFAIIKPRSRLGLDEIAPGCSSWPSWAREAAEAVRLAPSGANRQPWRMRMDGSLVLCATPKTYWTAPMDLGIAMLHGELGAAHAGVTGTWDLPSGDDVARFVPGESS